MKTSIYKYTKLTYIRVAVENGIFASHLDNVNDPFENQGIINCNNFRICCLTTIPNQRLMWSHYADSHRGCSIQFGRLEDYDNRVLRRVEYTREYINKRELGNAEIKQALYLKNKSWYKEREVRAVYCYGLSDDKYWKTVNNEIYFDAEVSCVNFGANSEESEYYLEVLKFLKWYNENHPKRANIKVQKYMLCQTNFGIKLDKQFDYLQEIKKLENESR